MSDDVELNAGSGGAVIKTDDDGTAHWQQVKVAAGADGTQTPILAGGGTEADALRVTIASNSTGVLSVDDNGATLSVDDGGATISIDDGGGSLTVDGTVAISGTVTTTGGGAVGPGLEATAMLVTVATDSTGLLSVDDNGGSLTVDNPVISVVGSGTEATAQRVTIATDSTGVLSIDDNGGSLTVDNGGTFAVQATLTASALNIGDVDVLTVPAPLSTTGGGTEATALRVTIANDSTGVVSVDDNGASLTVDNSTLAVVGGGTEATAMRVTVATDSTGVLSVDDNGSTLSVDDGAGSLTVDNATISVVGSGTEATAQRVTIATDSTGVLSVDDNGGNLSIDDGGNSITVDYATTGSGTATGALRVELPTNGTGVIATVGAVTAITNALPAGTNGIGKLTANSGVDIGDVDVTSIAAGDNNIGNVDIVTVPSPLSTAGHGTAAAALRVELPTDGTGVIATVGAVTTVSTLTTCSTLTGGGVAHDGIDSGNPLKVGARARTTNITAVASDDRTDLIADTLGALVVRPYSIHENLVSGATAAITDTTSTSVLPSAGASTRNYVNSVLVTNSHATVGTLVTITDGSGGTTLYAGYAAPAGGGFSANLAAPLRGSAATAVHAVCGTTGSNVYVSAAGYKSVV